MWVVGYGIWAVAWAGPLIDVPTNQWLLAQLLVLAATLCWREAEKSDGDPLARLNRDLREARERRRR